MTRTFGVVGLLALVLVSLLAAPAAAQPNVVGQWASVPALPFYPVHVALLPTGRVMIWPGDGGISGDDPRLWDPATATTTPLTKPGYDIFCSGHTLLADGRVFVAGGHIQNNVGLPNASAYDATTNAWTPFPAMNAGRWYPTSITLANGDPLVVSGSIDNTIGVNRLPQVLDLATGTWRNLTNAQLGVPLYPQMLLAPNGQVFNPGPSQTTRYLNTSGTGAWTVVGNRQFGLRSYGSAVMYADGKVLVMGGGDPPTRTAEVIDLNAPTPTWRLVGQMAIARRQTNAVLLPDGKVLVTGGTSGAGFNNAATPVFPAELWDPVAETWTTMASAQIPRLYHSAALLLPDGRVLTTGGNGYPDTEVYSPPYLFKGTRPSITTAPASVSYGQSFFVGTPDAAGVTSVTLLRLGSVTHTFNMNQRISRLSFTQTTGGLNVVAPTNANLAPLGHYMLFVVNGNGVPSVAEIVHLTPGPGGTTPTVSINDATVTEGNTGSVSAIFTVSLSAPSNQAVTVQYATANGTATAGSDYTAISGTLTFTPGQLTHTIAVPVLGDTVVEPNETFVVNLSDPINATLADGQGTGTILDNDGPVLSIGNATVTEGNTGTANAVFTVSLSTASSQTVTVRYATANGTATAGSDYTAISGALTFTAGQLTHTIAVPVLGDTVVEPNETFVVNLSDPINATLADGQGTGTILDNDGPMLSIGNATVTEGNTGTANAVFTVSLSTASSQTVTVRYATANGTATAGSDYTAVSGTLTFTPGQLTRTIAVPVLGDTVVEPNETFVVNLSDPINATLADGQGTGTILDNDGPMLSIGNATVTEGNTGTANAVFTVSLSTASSQTVTVRYATANGTATAGSDYTAVSGTLTFTPGQLTRTIAVPVLGDTVVEPNETFVVNLTSPANATLSDSQGTGTILNNDGPVLSIGNATVTEGNTGTANAVFTVSLSTASSQTVTVRYATANGTATAGSDYTAVSGTLTFAPGQLTRTIAVPVLGDTVVEPNETFVVNLTSPTNATLSDSQGTGTILNNDGPVLSIGNATVTEGNTGTANAVFTVSLSTASSQTVTVRYATANGTATAGSDYTAVSGTLTFAPGQLTRTIAVPVLGDTVVEPNETFVVNLTSPTNATLSDSQGAGTILNNDGPVLSIGNATVTEGNTGTANAVFTVSLSTASSQTVTVRYATANGTATAGSDYTAVSGTLTFAPGQLTRTIAVPVLGDTVVEPNETFVVNLTSPTNATLSDSQGTGTILNNDGPVLSIGNATVTEGNTGTANAVFTVSLSTASSQTVTVRYATANGTATAGSDYTAVSGTLTFAPGQLTRTIAVPVLGDTVVEPNETFVVNLTSPTNATLSDSQGAGTILNND